MKAKFVLLALLCLTSNAFAWMYIPSQHLECDTPRDSRYKGPDLNCRMVPGPPPERGTFGDPQDPNDVMIITKDINGYMTIERRDGSHETFKPNALGGWDRYN